MHNIKVNNIKGLAEINTEDWDWIKQLRDCTVDIPAIIRTPKGFKSVMENMGYISIGECSKYTDLWMSFGDELPAEDLSSISAVFMCENSKVASVFIDTRAVSLDTPCVVLIQTCKLKESKVATYYSKASSLAGVAGMVECIDLARYIRNLNEVVTQATARIIVTISSEDLESMSVNRLNALANAITEAERNPKITVDIVVVGSTNWTVNFKNVYGVSSTSDGYFVCRGVTNEYKQGKMDEDEVQSWLASKTEAVVNFLSS